MDVSWQSTNRDYTVVITTIELSIFKCESFIHIWHILLGPIKEEWRRKSSICTYDTCDRGLFSITTLLITSKKSTGTSHWQYLFTCFCNLECYRARLFKSWRNLGLFWKNWYERLKNKTVKNKIFHIHTHTIMQKITYYPYEISYFTHSFGKLCVIGRKKI